MSEQVEGWGTPKKILVILAHPDDPEFFCGAAVARWIGQGHQVSYCLLTSGDKGGTRGCSNPAELAHLRECEQRSAGNVLGVGNITFLRKPDGYLVPDLETRKEVVRIIRVEKPDIVVSCDPNSFFPREGAVNHPDHRAAGQVVMDAIFPAAGNAMFFPDLLDEGLLPHSVQEYWISSASQPNLILDVTDQWEMKILALYEHASQIPDRDIFYKRMKSRKTPDSTEENPRYIEKFFRVIFS